MFHLCGHTDLHLCVPVAVSVVLARPAADRRPLAASCSVVVCSEVLLLSTSRHPLALPSTSGLDHGLDLHLLQRPSSSTRRTRAQRQCCHDSHGLGEQWESGKGTDVLGLPGEDADDAFSSACGSLRCQGFHLLHLGSP